MNRIIEPAGSAITVDGHDGNDQPAYELRRGIRYVLQSLGRLPRTIEQHIATVQRLLCWDKDRTDATPGFHELLEALDID
jgi:osmoprotectant transport system ATP-binding protein